MRLGASLSLSGRYARFGHQAADGIRAWRRLCDDRVELSLVDDGSDPARAGDAVRALARDCELLLGPYSTQLMRAAAGALAGVDRVLWNQGGAGDDVQALGPGRIVSVLSPTSRYAEPFVRRVADGAAVLWIVRGPGRFGEQVADGAARAARELGVQTVPLVVGELARGFGERLGASGRARPWDLLSAGRYEDDLAIVETARTATPPPRRIGSVAAGVQDFGGDVAGGPQGIDGIAGWCAGAPGSDAVGIGPGEPAFLAAYRAIAGREPDYPAVQAAAAAALALHCHRTAAASGAVSAPAVFAVARELRTTTVYGRFAIDPVSGAQIGRLPLVVRWEDGERVAVR